MAPLGETLGPSDLVVNGLVEQSAEQRSVESSHFRTAQVPAEKRDKEIVAVIIRQRPET